MKDKPRKLKINQETLRNLTSRGTTVFGDTAVPPTMSLDVKLCDTTPTNPTAA